MRDGCRRPDARAGCVPVVLGAAPLDMEEAPGARQIPADGKGGLSLPDVRIGEVGGVLPLRVRDGYPRALFAADPIASFVMSPSGHCPAGKAGANVPRGKDGESD